MGEKSKEKAPKIFIVNWFRTDENGKFIWPGYGDNMRVLMWILKRCKGEVDAEKTSVGFVPKTKDLNLNGLNLKEETLKEILSIDKSLWEKEAGEIEEFFKKFEGTLPEELKQELNNLKERLKS